MMRHFKVWLAADTNRKKMQEAVQDVKGKDFSKPKDEIDDVNHDEDDDKDSMTKKASKSKAKSSKEKEPEPIDDDSAEVDSGDEADDIVGDFAMEDFELDSD